MPGLLSLFGGSSGKKGSTPNLNFAPVRPSYTANDLPMQMPAFQPGAENGMAADMAMGGFAPTTASAKGWLENTFRPTQSFYDNPDSTANPFYTAPTPTTPVTPVTPVVGGPTSQPKKPRYPGGRNAR